MSKKVKSNIFSSDSSSDLFHTTAVFDKVMLKVRPYLLLAYTIV